MKITFIMPSIGRKSPDQKYPKGWLMEPLAIAALSALTPDGIGQEFFDDRCDRIPYSTDTDLVAISVETYTAKRAYQIADRYRSLNVPVVLGGFHPTLLPEEAEQHADAICVGEAESVWEDILNDAKLRCLKKRYVASSPPLEGIKYNRAIYADKPYLKLALVETSRGCRFECDFCSIAAFYRKTYRARPVKEIIEEIRGIRGRKYIFFIDDNIGMDIARFRELLKALIPLKIRWSGQVSIHIAEDESLLELMRESGCQLVLIGLESLNPATLELMGKSVNKLADYDRCLERFRKYGIAIYATFVFGYPHDTVETFGKTFAFVKKHKLFFAAMNHLVPFPGTPLYRRLEREGKLVYDTWHLEENYHFGEAVFIPEKMTRMELTEQSFKWRRKLYDWTTILLRAMNFRTNCMPLGKAALFFYGNLLSGKEVAQRQKMTLGGND